MNKTILISLPIEDLQTVIIDCVNSCLRNNKQVQSSTNHPEQLFTIQKASEFLSLSVPTIYGKVSRDEIPYMKRGKRLYFSPTELMDYLKGGRKKSQEEIINEVDSFLSNKKKANQKAKK
jgi:excisionase family DNA binding protein